MNGKLILKILGKIMVLEGILMILPLIISIVYQELIINKLAFVTPILSLIIIGMLLQLLKPERKGLYQKEGFAVCALVWIIMTAFGAIPFVINGDIPNYVNALFETMSGFTTTGASILEDVTILSKSSLFWRSFTHWIGGMGILVFILIFISGHTAFIFSAIRRTSDKRSDGSPYPQNTISLNPARLRENTESSTSSTVGSLSSQRLSDPYAPSALFLMQKSHRFEHLLVIFT
mgnify:CR=1 FL=1